MIYKKMCKYILFFLKRIYLNKMLLYVSWAAWVIKGLNYPKDTDTNFNKS